MRRGETGAVLMDTWREGRWIAWMVRGDGEGRRRGDEGSVKDMTETTRVQRKAARGAEPVAVPEHAVVVWRALGCQSKETLTDPSRDQLIN